jgi:2-alkenal reductase
MSRLTQISLALIILLTVFVSLAGGAVVGGFAGYYFADQRVAAFERANEQVVIETVSSALEEAELPAQSEPRGLPEPAPSGSAASEMASDEQSNAMVQAVQEVAPAVVTVINRNNEASGSGSGVVVSEDGLIITNNHVVEGATELDVVFADGTAQDATLVGTDPLSDIALIEVDDAVPAVAALGDSDGLLQGEFVLAIGSPLGNFRNTVTAGVVSALGRSVGPLEGLIQTDASINRGNSGGPLINLNGEVVGINTLVVRGGGGGGVFGPADQAEGLGFAVPSSIVRIVSEQIIQTGEMVYPYMGIRYSMIDGDIAAQEGLAVQNGAYVAAVEDGTPADDAGLQADDVITAVDGVSLAQNNSLRLVLTGYRPGDTITLTVQRGSREIELDLTLGTRPAELDVQPLPPELEP